jgi:hypothetical protein
MDRVHAPIPRTVRAVMAVEANIATAANTAALTADNICHLWTTVECRPSVWTVMDVPGRCAYYYGSDAPRSKRVPVALGDQATSL